MSLNINKKLPYCPRGTRRNKITGECQPYNNDGKKKYCPRGTRRNRKSGECEKYEKLRKIKPNVGINVLSEVKRSSLNSKPLSITNTDIAQANADAEVNADVDLFTKSKSKSKSKTKTKQKSINKKSNVRDDGQYVPFIKKNIPKNFDEFLSLL